MNTPRPIHISLDRRLLEHPDALHLRRMRSALWLYLVILSRLPSGSDTVEIPLTDLVNAMGLPEGTIRSWLGHLRKHRYIAVRRTNGTVRIQVKRHAVPEVIETAPSPPPRFFTVGRVARALGEAGSDSALTEALAAHGDDEIKRALARTLAVPQEQIRRSRTALFLYLLNHHD